MIHTKPLNNTIPAREKLLVSILTPAYNEADIIEKSVQTIYDYMQQLEDEYDWELVVVNDGSRDNTGKLADELARTKDNMRVIHHKINRNLGGALQTGFRHCRGDYVIVLDIDLTYAPYHIERLLVEAVETDADIVVASPYMKGGKTTKIPFKRELLSRAMNKLLRWTSPADLHTYTGMVRAYKREFLQNLNLKSNTYTINPEIINKACILRSRIQEIPAHLDWSEQSKVVSRTSSIKILSGIFSGLMTGFIFRPYAFFMTIGGILSLISIYVIGWIFVNTFAIYPDIAVGARDVEQAFSLSVATVFQDRPYSFFVGGVTLILALQFLSLGFLSLQSKRYFDELFHLGSSIFKNSNNAVVK
ncbi:MAG: glycosyl transferase family 2 [Bacteroidetes bacterium]|nr:MAG: glycosyl transferase family 2 [Bacteroidota bacterium]PTM15093.1 MAG: glycosyl transferase family 2 [Bacteroidota bacterium]